jgi:uncharacterized protein YaiE (UPF0345 family)
MEFRGLDPGALQQVEGDRCQQWVHPVANDAFQKISGKSMIRLQVTDDGFYRCPAADKPDNGSAK